MSERATRQTFVCSGSKLLKLLPPNGDGHTIRRFEEHSIIIEANDDDAAAGAFEARTGFPPNYINTRELAGLCEACTKPVYVDQPDRWWDDEGVNLCPNCAPKGDTP